MEINKKKGQKMIQESMQDNDKVNAAIHGAYSTLPKLEECSHLELMQLVQAYQNIASICLNQLMANQAKTKTQMSITT